LLIEAIGFGIATGAVIALGAVGFSVQFGISNILNITYGSLMTLAAYLGLLLIDRRVNPWVTLAASALAVGTVSVIYHRVLLAPLVRRGTRSIAVVIVTVSAGIILQYVIVAIAGPDSHSYGEQSGRTVHLLGMTLSSGQVTIIILTSCLMLGHRVQPHAGQELRDCHRPDQRHRLVHIGVPLWRGRCRAGNHYRQF